MRWSLLGDLDDLQRTTRTVKLIAIAMFVQSFVQSFVLCVVIALAATLLPSSVRTS